MNNDIVLDHCDIVVTHKCNMHCPFCVDRFKGASNNEVLLEDIDRFSTLVSKYAPTGKKLEMLLLGGEPTVLDIKKLEDIAMLLKSHSLSPIMSTNGIEKEKIERLIGVFDWIQVTVTNDNQISYYKKWKNKICVKFAGDQLCTIDKFKHFIESTIDFKRRCISMYSTPDFVECCTDKEVWNVLNSLDWFRNGSYLYSFYKGVRLKRFIKGETNIIDEPTVPKLYPNGNYNKTWTNEDMDPYLGVM